MKRKKKRRVRRLPGRQFRRPKPTLEQRSAERAAAWPPLLARFLPALPVLWLIFTFVVLLIHIAPRDPVEQVFGKGAVPDKWRRCGARWVSISRCWCGT